MSNRIQRAVMMGLLISIGVGTGACLSPLGTPCGDGWCPDGFLCTSVDHVCVKSECGNGILEAEVGEECDDGDLDDEDDCLSTCQRHRCGDGTVNPRAEECDDGNLDDEDDCLSTCQLHRCGDGKVDPRAEACDDGNINNDDGCNNDCTISLFMYIKASNTDAADRFGYSVALSADGSTLAVGALWEDSAATVTGGNQADNSAGDSGAVYVFTLSGTTWRQQAYVKASNTGAGDQFGWSVALSADGSTLAVGAPGEDSAAIGIGGNQDDNSAGDSGAAYVFTRSGTTWSQQAYVKASNTGAGDQFGWSVALSADGSTLAVGALYEDSAATGIGGNQANNSAGDSGAIYVLARSGTTWSQQAYVKASNTGTTDEFGLSVTLSADGSTLAVGAYGEDSSATGIGGNQANNYADSAGAVYVFTRSGTTWSQQAYVKASDTFAWNRFGLSVALSTDGSTLAVSALGVGMFGTSGKGAVYVFTRSDTTWSQQAYVNANTSMGDYFGWGIALSGDGLTLAVGARIKAASAGAVYVFTRSGTTWSQRAPVYASNTAAGDRFGTSVALSADGSTLAVGAAEEDSAATGIGGDQADNSAGDSGAVYVYPLPAQQSLSTTAALSEPAAPASVASVPSGWLGQ